MEVIRSWSRARKAAAEGANEGDFEGEHACLRIRERAALDNDGVLCRQHGNERRKTAFVALTAEGIIPGERDINLQELQVSLKKSDNEWLIKKVETVRSLR